MRFLLVLIFVITSTNSTWAGLAYEIKYHCQDNQISRLTEAELVDSGYSIYKALNAACNGAYPTVEFNKLGCVDTASETENFVCLFDADSECCTCPTPYSDCNPAPSGSGESVTCEIGQTTCGTTCCGAGLICNNSGSNPVCETLSCGANPVCGNVCCAEGYTCNTSGQTPVCEQELTCPNNAPICGSVCCLSGYTCNTSGQTPTCVLDSCPNGEPICGNVCCATGYTCGAGNTCIIDDSGDDPPGDPVPEDPPAAAF